MADPDIDITIKAKAAIAAAFAEATKAMDAIDKAADKAGSSATKGAGGLNGFGGVLKTTFAGAGIALGVAGSAVTALAAGVIALGSRGADVADIRDSFNQMNATIGQNGPKSLAALKTAFAGTVSDYDLMKASNKALSLGLKLSSEDFSILGRSARVLADRTGGDATTALEKLTTAMATGKTKALAKIGVMVQGTDVLGSLKTMLAESGDAGFDFADAVAASTTFVNNFKDSLGEAIAKSPVVNAMLASFGKGLQASFGADQAGLIKTLIGYVNKFAIFLVDVASVGLTTAGVIYKGFSALQSVFHLVTSGLAGIAATLNETAASALELATKIPGVGDSFKVAAWQARDMANMARGVANSFKESQKAAHDAAQGNDVVGRSIKSMQGGLSSMRGEMVKALTTQADLTTATKKAVVEIHEKTKAEIAAEKQYTKSITAMEKWAKSLDNDVHKAMAKIVWSAKELKDHFEALEKTLKIHGSTVIDITKYWREFPKAVVSSAEKAKKAAEDQTAAYAEMRNSLGKLGDGFAQMAQVSGGSLGETAKWLGTTLSAINLTKTGTDSMKTGFNQMSGEGKNVAAGLVNIASGAMSVYASMMQATVGTNKLKTAMSGAMAGAQAGSMFGPWGTAIGAVAGGIFSLFRGSSQRAAQAAAEMKATAEKLAAELKAANEKLLADLTAAATATRNEIQGLITTAAGLGYVFDQQGKYVGVSFTEMSKVAKSYGIDLASLGPTFQSARLGDIAKTIIDDFTLLTKGGADVGGVLFGMKDKVSALVQESITFGTSIPSNMKPWIDELDRAGLLVDTDGKKLTDLSKLKFGDPIKTQFEQISDALLTAINRLNEILGQIAAIPTNKTMTVRTEYVDEGNDDRPRGDNSDGYAVGGIVNAPMSGMGVTVHGREAIIPLNRPSVVGSALIREIIAVSDKRSGGADGARLANLESAIATLTSSVATLPGQLTRSYRDSQLAMGSTR